ncbi:MAG: ribose 5-phosphate isomerase A [Thermoplasmata archaeon]
MNPKLAAAAEAAKLVRDGQVVGLGSGSTAELAILELGKRTQEEGMRIIGIPTSRKSEAVGRGAGIPISTLDEHDVVDITIDGADEVDPNLDLIKGLGGALLREKIVAGATKKEVIVIDESKLVERLGTRAPLPVEVIQFSHEHLGRKLASLGCIPKLRLMDEKPFVTDNGNYIYDCTFANGISEAKSIDSRLQSMPGVVETGLFIGIADLVIVGSSSGVRVIRRSELDEECLLR